MWFIKGMNNDGVVEIIDECQSESEGMFLVNEYRMAFGDGWSIWIETARN